MIYHHPCAWEWTKWYDLLILDWLVYKVYKVMVAQVWCQFNELPLLSMVSCWQFVLCSESCELWVDCAYIKTSFFCLVNISMQSFLLVSRITRFKAFSRWLLGTELCAEKFFSSWTIFFLVSFHSYVHLLYLSNRSYDPCACVVKIHWICTKYTQNIYKIFTEYERIIPCMF